MKKVIKNLSWTLLGLVIVLGASSPSGAAVSNDRYKFEASYQAQDYSFTQPGHAASLDFTYEIPRQWAAHVSVNPTTRFGLDATAFHLGGSWWTGSETTISLDAALAPDQAIVPRQAYTAEIGQKVNQFFVPAIGYRFAEYQIARVHSILPSITWTASPQWDGTIRGFVDMNDVTGGASNDTRVSGLVRLNWHPHKMLTVSLGTSKMNQAFEAGNPVSQTAGFTADHLFGAVSWNFMPGLAVNGSLDKETRSTGVSVQSTQVALFTAW